MASDFYTTMAQVFPLLLLALIWDSSFLDRLRRQQRRLRRVDPEGVWFWTKPRVRAFTLFVATLAVGLTGISLLELAGFIPNSLALRVVISCGLVLVLGALLTRIWIDVIAATAGGAGGGPDGGASEPGHSGAGGGPGPGSGTVQPPGPTGG
jgi:hypothetical protein